MTTFWVEEVKNILPIPLDSILKTFPVYISIWLVSLFFNGVYDQAYKATRVVRGMAIGTVVILAYYGLLPPELRYSRAIIIFSAFIGTVAMLGLHGLLYRLGIFKFIRYDELPGKGVIVAHETEYVPTIRTLKNVRMAPEITGRIEPSGSKGDALATLPELRKFAYAADIEEIIFCINGLSYAEMFRQMKICGKGYEYKIHIPGSNSFVGSNSSQSAGDLYTLDRRYNLSDFAKRRNKRVTDVFSSLVFILLFPVFAFFVRNPGRFFSNCMKVLWGKNTWVGYSGQHPELPPIRAGILPVYSIAEGYSPDETATAKLDILYAQDYASDTDIKLILKNFKYLGGF